MGTRAYAEGGKPAKRIMRETPGEPLDKSTDKRSAKSTHYPGFVFEFELLVGAEFGVAGD